MLTTLYYFLQVVLCSGIMMGYYWLVLRNKRFHQYNRFYILAIAALAWIVPLIKIQWNKPENNDLQLTRFFSVIADNNSEIESGLTGSSVYMNWQGALVALYILVALVLLTGMTRAILRIYQLLKNHSCKTIGDVYLILTTAEGAPFSFFRYIFWHESIDLKSEAGKQMMQHELTHVRQKHSIDKIGIQLVLIAGWFNPFFWLMKKEMEMIHEFIADHKAVARGDAASLAQMLLTASYPQQQHLLTNPFFFSPIKRRLQMITNQHHPKFSYLRRLVVLPLLAVLVICFSFRNKDRDAGTPISVSTVLEQVYKEVPAALKPATSKAVPDRGTIILNSDSVYRLPKGKPVKLVQPNGKTATVVVDGNRLQLQEHKQGSNLLSSFPDGKKPLIVLNGEKVSESKLSAISPNDIATINVMKGGTANALFKDEVAENGVIMITTKNAASGELKVKIRNEQEPVTKLNEKVLVVLDGVVQDKSLGELNILPEKIASVSVLKGKMATQSYGERASGGAILIKTKEGFVTVREYNEKPEEIKIVPFQGLPVVKEQPEEPAHFPGGKETWPKYLYRNLNKDLPRKAGAPPGNYTVQLSFLVAANGLISNLRAENNPGYGTAEEAVRVIRYGPKWVPAKQGGKAVSSQVTQTIRFVVNE
ncbi:MAG TPA: M56 family metallopeptidase [Sediminibacterium sp.]|nr:M56 family metallopeptidase [Sediminibacterium sp.]